MPRIKPALRRAYFLCRGGNRLNGFDDELASRGFHLLLTAFLGWVLFMGLVVDPFFAVRKIAGGALILLLGLVALAALVLLRRGRKRAAATLFLSVFWSVLAAFSVLSGGIVSEGPYLAFVVILDAAWLLGLSASLCFAGLTLLIALAEALFEYSGHRLPI